MATWGEIIDDFKFRPCVRSGTCCKTIQCAFGEWDAAKHQCKFLQEAEHGPGFTIYACGKKAEIDALPFDMRADLNPAFGAGCCMPMFNQARRAILAAKGHNK